MWAIWRTAARRRARAATCSRSCCWSSPARRAAACCCSCPCCRSWPPATGLRCGTGRRARDAARARLLWAAVGARRARAGRSTALGAAGRGRHRRAAGRRLPTKLGFDVARPAGQDGALLVQGRRRHRLLPGRDRRCRGSSIAAASARASRGGSRSRCWSWSPALALLYSLNAAGPDERYVLYLAPLVLLPATLALARRELSPLGIGDRLGRCCALLLLRVAVEPRPGAVRLLRRAGRDVLLARDRPRLDRYLPGGRDAAVALAALGARRRSASRSRSLLRWAPAAARAAAAARCWSPRSCSACRCRRSTRCRKYVNGAGSQAGAERSASARSWTRTVPAGATRRRVRRGRRASAAVLPDLAGGAVLQPAHRPRLRARRQRQPGRRRATRWSAASASTRDTGRVRSPEPLPDYLVIPTPVGDGARSAARSSPPRPTSPVALIAVAQPADAGLERGRASSPTATSRRRGGRGALLRHRPAPRQPQCAAITYARAARRAASWRMSIDGDVGLRRARSPPVSSAT